MGSGPAGTIIDPVPPQDADPSELDYLVVLTYGRSGSTLLQGLLNSIPGYLIRGENRQVLRHLWEADRTLRQERQKQQRWLARNAPGEELPPTHAFYGIDGYPRRKALRLARRYAVQTLFRPEPETRVAGFKEIRWAEPDAAEFVGWLREVFPGVRFVVNTRNLDDVAKSAWWADDPEARGRLAAAEERLLAIGDDLGEAAYRVHYDDYVGRPDELAGLFSWLGEDFDRQAVADVMDVRHSWPYTVTP